MARVEFTTFREACEYTRKLALASRSYITIQRDGEVWWVENPSRSMDFDISDNPFADPVDKLERSLCDPFTVISTGKPKPLFKGDPKLQKMIHKLAELPEKLHLQMHYKTGQIICYKTGHIINS